MTTFSSIPSYILGGACFGRGLMALYSPRKEYGHVGLPLESSATHQTNLEAGGISPLMYFKGLREISYGLTLMVLQRQGNKDAVTTFAAVLSIVRIGDGLVVWLKGREELRWRAMGHWITGVGFVGIKQALFLNEYLYVPSYGSLTDDFNNISFRAFKLSRTNETPFVNVPSPIEVLRKEDLGHLVARFLAKWFRTVNLLPDLHGQAMSVFSIPAHPFRRPETGPEAFARLKDVFAQVPVPIEMGFLCAETWLESLLDDAESIKRAL